MHIHLHIEDNRQTKELLVKILDNQHLIIKQNHTIMSTQQQVADQLTALSTQLDKALAEIQAEIQKLQDAVTAGGNSSPEVDAALDSLKSKVQALDDLNADPSTGGETGTTPP